MTIIPSRYFATTVFAKLKSALRIGAMIVLAGSVTTTVRADDAPSHQLSTGEIFKKAQEKYASLTSYVDEGKVVSTVNGTTITTAFTTRLARTNLYRVEWEQRFNAAAGQPKGQKQAVWSGGDGDYSDFLGQGPQKQASQEMALASGTGISGGASSSVPGTFYKLNWGNQLGGAVSDQKRQTDEKLGDVECFVLERELKGVTNTLWIGKQDFLIHQVRNITSAETLKIQHEDLAKRMPGMHLPAVDGNGIISTETHTKIVVNLKLSPEEFTRWNSSADPSL